MKFLVADDHPLVRRALSLTLDRLCPGAAVLEADSLPGALRVVEEHPDLDLFLLDLFMPGSRGLDGLEKARMAAAPVPVAVISADEAPETALGALECGVAGYLPKSLPEDVMRAALSLILAGGVYVPPMIAERALRGGGPGGPSLRRPGPGTAGGGNMPAGMAGGAAQAAGRAALTPRQCEVLELVIEGLSNKEIAERLTLAEATVKVHITAILRAYNVSNRARAISAVQRERGGEDAGE